MMQSLAFYGICAYCFLASISGADFAKLHIALPLLDCPIFIGELILFFCAAVLASMIDQGRVQLTKTSRLFLLYLAGIIVWALWDYARLHTGALAFRNAILFLYPVFAFFVYSFYPARLLSHRAAVLLAVLFYLAARNSPGYFSFVYLMLFLGVFSSRTFKPWEYALGGVLLVLWPYGLFLSGARTWLVAGAGAFLFLIFIFVKHFLKLKQWQKWLAGAIAFAFFLSGSFYLADKRRLEVLLAPAKVISTYQRTKDLIRRREPSFHPKRLAAHLYNETYDKRVFNVFFKYEPPIVQQQMVQQDDGGMAPKGLISDQIEQAVLEKKDRMDQLGENTKEGPLEQNHKWRSVKAANNNVIFRILIWEDMARELWERKSLLGVGMGWPQRSRNIEILNWAPGEWKRDGWITPHNSFLHLIYRAGLVGLGVICAIFIVLYGLIKDFIKMRSYAGILLSGILVYGLVAANFLLILELPYYAIPFWSIFGLTLAYRRDLRDGIRHAHSVPT